MKFEEFKDFSEKYNKEILKESWFESYENAKSLVYPILDDSEKEWSNKMFEKFLEKSENISVCPVLCHGDFDESNVLISRGFDSLQVVDFEDISIWDPAGDFCAWLDPKYWEKFVKIMIEAYSGEVDEYFFDRVRFYYDRIPFIYFNFWVEKGLEDFIEWGRRLMMERMKI